MKKIAIINSEECFYYLDHIAPLSHILQAPLLLSSEEHYETCVEYYPDILLQKMDYADFTPQFLLENFDAVIVAEVWNRSTTAKKFQGLEDSYNKKMRVIHCPHGFSDKTYVLKDSAYEDILYVFGQNFFDLLQEEGVLDHMAYFVMTGNFRYRYYKKYQEHFDALIQKKVFQGIEKREKVFLYAPTWPDAEDASSFFSFHEKLFSSVPKEYTLLVKPHPRIAVEFLAELLEIQGLAEQKENIYFIEEPLLIYPLLNQVDVYIGDMSSIGYDFLAFDRPLFFLNKLGLPHGNRRAYLFQAGVVIGAEEMGSFWDRVKAELGCEEKEKRLSAIRKELYKYTFAPDVGFDDILEGTLDALNLPRIESEFL